MLFPTVNDLNSELPEKWPPLFLVAATVFLEAENQPDTGKLAVAAVIFNRVWRWNKEIRQVILGPDGKAYSQYEAFSCWNEDYRTLAEHRLKAPIPTVWDKCWFAAIDAAFQKAPDPTSGADHYLNVPLTRAMRGGTLPAWVEQMDRTFEIGNHTFYRSRREAG